MNIKQEDEGILWVHFLPPNKIVLISASAWSPKIMSLSFANVAEIVYFVILLAALRSD